MLLDQPQLKEMGSNYLRTYLKKRKEAPRVSPFLSIRKQGDVPFSPLYFVTESKNMPPFVAWTRGTHLFREDESLP